jgi:hypothetical protein
MKTYINDKSSGSCDLLTLLWNVAIFYGWDESEYWEQDYDSTSCTESCDDYCSKSKEVIAKFGLRFKEGKLDTNWVINNLPVEFNLPYYKKTVPVLAVDFDLLTQKVCLANFHKGKLVWMSIPELLSKQVEDRLPRKWIKLN